MVQCQACRDHHGTVQGTLRTVGVLGGKHIPMAYLRASEVQRRLLLAGLLDTDGTVAPTGERGNEARIEAAAPPRHVADPEKKNARRNGVRRAILKLVD